MNQWMDKEDVVCVCVYIYIYKIEFYSAIKENEILPFVTTWIDLESIMFSETSQTEKDKYCVFFSCMEDLKNKTNVQI